MRKLTHMESTKILLFGGSYNPIHQGHINAALNVSNYLKCDQVWLIPRKYNYDGSLLLAGKHRVNMLKIAIKDLPNFSICDIELKDKKKELLYTYNTAKRLIKKYAQANYRFYFLIGADQLNNLQHWYKVEELTQLFTFVCFRRPGYPIHYQIAERYHIEIIDGKQIDASSTNVRAGYFDIIDDKIQKYIQDHQLYLKERIMPKLDEKRFLHCLTTARLSKQIAASLGENTNRAYVAGILHDIAKGLSYDEIERIIKKYYPKCLNYPSFCYHAFASEYLAKTEYGIKDKIILKAIRNHCRPTKNMSRLDKIIYCADILEETREFASTLNEVRQEAFKDIDYCFVLVLKEQIAYFKSKKQKIDANIIRVLHYYDKEGKHE